MKKVRPTETPNIHKMTPEDVGHLATCLCCKNFVVDNATHGYSEMTPGSPAGIYCDKGHFDYDEYDARSFFKTLHDLGARCPDFTPPPGGDHA